MKQQIKPIFLFSLPRSGSTLIQRVLASSKQISTVSEPWIMLPLLNARRLEGAFADYSHLSSYYAIDEFIKNLPDQETTYRVEVKRFILNLYEQVSEPNAKYFLDKTPRYHIFAHEIIKTFGDDAYYIFLWRNPLAVIASLIETWGRKWNIYKFKIDIYQGLSTLIETYQKSSNNVIAVNYESLVNDQAGNEWEKLFTYLGADFSPAYLSSFHEVQLSGTAGDFHGMRAYHSISTDPMDKWKMVLSNPIRKKWCKNYIRWIGNERLSIMGYEQNKLLDQIDSIDTSWKGSVEDMGRMTYGELRCLLSLRSIYNNIQKLPDLRNILSFEY